MALTKPQVEMLPTGTVLQVVNVQTGALSSSATSMPLDNTIPQNTEGTELFTLSITPKSATSKLLIQVVVQTASSPANWLLLALFQDSTANAIASTAIYNTTNTGASCMPLNYYMTSGTTSATTFKLRYGQGGGGTMYINGSTSQLLGGSLISSMTITEIAA